MAGGISPAVCQITPGSQGWQFAATPSPPKPINLLGQVFTAQYKGQYLALTGTKLAMQDQPFSWSLESTSATSSTLWGVFAVVPLEYVASPTSIPYIAAPTSPTAPLSTAVATDPGSDTPFYLNANGIWFAVDANSHFSIYAPSVQQFYIPGTSDGGLIPSQDVSQIYGWVFTAVSSPVIGTPVPSGDYYFTVPGTTSGTTTLFLNSGAQNTAAVLLPTFNLANSIFSWHAEAPVGFSPKCNPGWMADETMNTFFLTFLQESPMELPFQITDKGGIITANAPGMTFVGLPYRRKDSTLVVLFRPSAWVGGAGNKTTVLQPVPYGTAVLPTAIANGTYQIKHGNVFLNAQGQLGPDAANWNYDAKTSQLSLVANPSLCLLNPNPADVCANKTVQALSVGNCSASGATASTQRFVLGQDGTFRDPVTKLCYSDTLFGGGAGNAPIIMGHYSLISFIVALLAWAAFIVIFILRS